MGIDDKYMRLAIELAKRAEGRTSPNPIVGAVIAKNGKIVGRGYHKRAGLPHAEVNAIRQAGRRAKGATLYVSLEPCDHFGRTPPCTDAIIKSGIRRAVIAMKDPNPVNNGRGIKKLKRHGIKTVLGVLKSEAMSINKPYIKFVTKGLPYITVKVAQSLDGKIAAKTGDSRWISSEDSRRYVHELRAKADAVMVGAGTVLKDDPLLLSRVSGGRQPMRIVVAGKRKIPSSARIFTAADKSPVVIVNSPEEALRLKDVTNILVEGGGGLIASLIEKDLVDRFLIFIAPKIIGGISAKTAVEGSGVRSIKDAMDFKIVSVRRFRKDVLIEAER